MIGTPGGSGSSGGSSYIGSGLNAISDRNLGDINNIDISTYKKMTDALNNEIYNYSQKDKKEWGYFLTIKNNELWAREITKGESNITWKSFSNDVPLKLSQNEYLVGFIHVHLTHNNNWKNQFSWFDMGALIKFFANRRNSTWNIPKNSNALFMGVITPLEINFIQFSKISTKEELLDRFYFINKDINALNGWSFKNFEFNESPETFFHKKSTFNFYRFKRK